jgi:hypothetical protein
MASKRRWPTKDTLYTIAFLAVCMEIVWVFLYRVANNLYRSGAEITLDLFLMSIFAVQALYFAYRDHQVFIGKKK